MGAAVPIRDDIPAEELRRLARPETDGRVACRLLGLANVLDGMKRTEAAGRAGMDRQTLRDWVIRFNAEGIEPDPERDGVSTWRAKDLCRAPGFQDRPWWSVRSGASRTAAASAIPRNGMLRLLHDLGLSWQKARPIHPETDLKAQARFIKNSRR